MARAQKDVAENRIGRHGLGGLVAAPLVNTEQRRRLVRHVGHIVFRLFVLEVQDVLKGSAPGRLRPINGV